MKRGRISSGLFASLVIIALAIMATNVQAEGIGIYPSNIAFGDALRTGEYYQDVGVVNDGDDERLFTFEVGGPIADWMSIQDISDRDAPVTELRIPAHSDGHVFLRLQVPDDTPNGNYTGWIRVVTAIDATIEGSALNVNVGAEASVAVDITGTQTLAGSLRDVTATDTEVGLPLRVRSEVLNESNVTIQPEVLLRLEPVVDARSGTGTSQPLDFAPFLQEERIFPAETATLLTEIPTDNIVPGPYLLHVSVRFGDFSFGDRVANVTVHPRGTLTSSGELLSLSLLNDPGPGGLARIGAEFINTGQIDSTALLFAELYHDGELVQAISGQERFVNRGDTTSLELLVEVPEKGDYRLLGKVNFGGNESEAKELKFQVGVGGSSTSLIPVVVVAIAAVLLGAGMGLWLRTRRSGIRVPEPEPGS